MRALALDIGGVVYRSWPDEAFHARWAETLGREPEELGRRLWGGPHWGLAELGQITADECYTTTAAGLGVSPGLVRQIAFEAFASQPDEALARYVEDVRRRGHIVAALTNNLAHEAELLARPELARLFDLAITSADAGLAKPDPAFFRHAEARLGARGEEIVFVDDVPVLVEAARGLDWRAIQFHSTDQAIADIEAALTAPT